MIILLINLHVVCFSDREINKDAVHFSFVLSCWASCSIRSSLRKLHWHLAQIQSSLSHWVLCKYAQMCSLLERLWHLDESLPLQQLVALSAALCWRCSCYNLWQLSAYMWQAGRGLHIPLGIILCLTRYQAWHLICWLAECNSCQLPVASCQLPHCPLPIATVVGFAPPNAHLTAICWASAMKPCSDPQ